MASEPTNEPDPDHLDGFEAFDSVEDLDELGRRFEALDAELKGVDDAEFGNRALSREDRLERPIDPSDPFADLAEALRDARMQDAGLGSGHELGAAGGAGDGSMDGEEGGDEPEVEETEQEVLAREIEQLCHDALEAFEEGDLDQAEALAMQAVRLDDEHPFPMFVLGLIAERRDDIGSARDLSELALRTAQTNADAIGLRAHIHVREHEFEDAERLLRFGVAHNPDDAQLHEGLARVALARGRHDEALRSASAALRLEPGNPGALAVRSAALDEQGDRGALLAALRQGVQLHPEDPYAMVDLASVEVEHGNIDRARSLLMRAQRLAPRDHDIGDVRALVEELDGHPMLRPVPHLLQWLREFPGGMAGFLGAFAISALPLYALADSSAQYAVPATVLIGLWGAVALYAWVAPAVLTLRLNQHAGRTGRDRVSQELRDPKGMLPSIARTGDVVAMLLTGHDRHGAAELLALAGRRYGATNEAYQGDALSADVANELEAMSRRLRGPRARLRTILVAVPGAARLLLAISVLAAIAAPLLAKGNGSGSQAIAAYGVAAMAAFTAWRISRAEEALVRDVDELFTALQMEAESGADPRSDDGRGAGPGEQFRLLG